MNENEIPEQLLGCLSGDKVKPMTPAQLAARLGLRGKARKQVDKHLHRLVADGTIVRIRDNHYCLADVADLVVGRLTVLRGGNGFVNSVDGARSVFVRSDDMDTALPGDRVVARIERGRGMALGGAGGHARERAHAEPSGKVIRIEERSRRDVVGTLQKTERFLYVVPLDPIYRSDFYVADAKGATIGDRVVMRFLAWPNRHVSPEGEITEVIGPWEEASADTLAILRHHNIREEFDDEVLREAESVSVRMEDSGPREDLRDTFILTIDPARSRDFDDALSLTVDRQGRRELGVHIADVSHFVQAGGKLDCEARERGNSVYFPDRVVPMLPEQLSNGVCSLNPDVDRLAFSAFLTLDAQGQVTATRFARTRIQSRLRLTYEQALAAIEGPADQKAARALPDTARRMLADLHGIAQTFRKRRFAQSALELDMPECEVIVDRHGHMTGLRMRAGDAAHQLVEECMVAANEAVARELHRRGMGSIHRFHEAPRQEKLEELTAALIELGFQPGDLSQPRIMAAFLRKLSGSPLQNYARMAVLKSLNRAIYSASDAGHYGLAKAHYAHFTSPIRRYSDLVVHRQLAAALAGANGGPAPYDQGTLKGIAMVCTEREQNADMAERALLEIKKYRYLALQVTAKEKDIYEAVIVSVLNFGLFVELIELQVQGLIHISALSRQFVTYDRQTGSLQAGKQAFRVGKRVRVTISAVNFDKRKIDFELARPSR